MPDLRPVLYILGLFLVVLGVAMLLPAAVDAAERNRDWQTFVGGSAISVFVGGALVLTNRGIPLALDLRQGFLLTTSSWVVLAAFAAVPFTFGELDLSFTDAFFEAISGLTTTGSTILVGLDAMPPGILLWRAILQWLGGIGIIAMGVAMLPFLRVGGMQLFRMESSDVSAKILPRAGQIAASIGGVYLGLSVLCALGYWLAGMNAFEAIAHAMTTVSTGGYSTSDSSIGHFESASVEAIGTVFMLLGGMPFVLFVQAVRGEPRALLLDRQVHGFLWILAAATAVLSTWLWLTRGTPILEAVRSVGFNVVSVVTTCGYASTDYGAWGGFAVIGFFLLTFVGGCTGSTSGAIKIFRLQIAAVLFRGQILRLIHPRGVFVRLYNRRPLPEDVILSSMVFVFAFIGGVGVIAAGLGMLGLDFVTAASGAATAVANVGPGLGPIIGPAGNFQPLPDAAKWLMAAGMLLGRLEFFTVLVLFTPTFWRS